MAGPKPQERLVSYRSQHRVRAMGQGMYTEHSQHTYQGSVIAFISPGDAEAREAKGLVYDAHLAAPTSFLHVPLSHPTKANAKTSANAKGMTASGRHLASIRGLDTAEDSTKAFLPTPMARNGSQKSTSHQNAGNGCLTA